MQLVTGSLSPKVRLKYRDLIEHCVSYFYYFYKVIVQLWNTFNYYFGRLFIWDLGEFLFWNSSVLSVFLCYVFSSKILTTISVWFLDLHKLFFLENHSRSHRYYIYKFTVACFTVVWILYQNRWAYITLFSMSKR